MKNYLLTISGCDDATYVAVDLTEDQFALLAVVASLVNAQSDYRCMPRMYVEEKA